MVGHTGDLPATVAACALVDACVAELLEVCNEVKGRFLLTSDHGNADDMVQVGAGGFMVKGLRVNGRAELGCCEVLGGGEAPPCALSLPPHQPTH